jgi:NAD(P)-dependent dehydrogenase (short-subunit alcohol dehydrogenase family)
VDEVVSTLGKLDILVNNAGVGYLMGPVTDFADEEWDVTLDVNLKGAFLCARAAARHMVERQEGGRIVSIASQGGKSGFPFAAAYCSSKHGLIGLTRVLAIELGPHDITANCVCPNHVTTGLGAWQNDYFAERLGLTMEEYRAQMLSRIPLGRNCTQDDIARAVAWLSGPDAAYVTGEALNVAGGEETH